MSDLLEAPFTDDLDEQLAAKAPRRYWTRLTATLAGLVLLAVGFLAGAQTQRQFGTRAATPAVPNFAAARPQRTAAPAADVTTGTVKYVDGSTVYVETADGNVITVRTTDSTAVQLAQAGALKDLAVGAKVSVEGRSAGQDTVTATKVTRAG